MSPIANDEHQSFAGRLFVACCEAIEDAGRGEVRPAINLSDRVQDWVQNYRNPDLVVFLNGTEAVNHETHWVGGPDFAAEIVSPGETPAAKFAFYESIGTKEVFVVHRKPWKLELLTLTGGRLVLASASSLAGGVCASAALGLTFQLVPGGKRPRVAVTQPATGRSWSV